MKDEGTALNIWKNPCDLNENETHYIEVLDPCDPDLCTIDRLVSDHELQLTMSV